MPLNSSRFSVRKFLIIDTPTRCNRRKAAALFHISLAYGSGIAAQDYDGRSSGYAHIHPFMTELAGRKARN